MLSPMCIFDGVGRRSFAVIVVGVEKRVLRARTVKAPSRRHPVRWLIGRRFQQIIPQSDTCPPDRPDETLKPSECSQNGARRTRGLFGSCESNHRLAAINRTWSLRFRTAKGIQRSFASIYSSVISDCSHSVRSTKAERRLRTHPDSKTPSLTPLSCRLDAFPVAICGRSPAISCFD